MRKKILEELRANDRGELEKMRGELVKEIALLKLNRHVNPPKDTNLLVKKQKRLARLLTIVAEKRG